MSTQVVNAWSISNSTIVQVGGDYRQILVVGAPQFEKPIYLTYADSDVQTLYLGTRAEKKTRYFSALDAALRLLLVFKPFSSPILVSASSVIQSGITRHITNKYHQLLDCSPPHIQVLRRESDWSDYFEKRMENTQGLASIPRYGGYYDPEIRTNVSAMTAVRKKVHCGISTSSLWLAQLSRIRPDVSARQIDLLSVEMEEVLSTSVFVWEAILPALSRAGISIRPWDNSLLTLLVDSYLDGFRDTCIFPTGIALDWDPCPCSSSVTYTNLRVLSDLVCRLNCAEKLLAAPVSALAALVNHEALFEFRSVFYAAADSQDAIQAALAVGEKFSSALSDSLKEFSR